MSTVQPTPLDPAARTDVPIPAQPEREVQAPETPRVNNVAKNLFGFIKENPGLITRDAKEGALEGHTSFKIDLKAIKDYGNQIAAFTQQQYSEKILKNHSGWKIFGLVVGAVVVGAAAVAVLVGLKLSGAFLVVGALIALILLGLAVKEWRESYREHSQIIKGQEQQLQELELALNEGKEDLRKFFTPQNKGQIREAIQQSKELSNEDKSRISEEFDSLMKELYPKKKKEARFSENVEIIGEDSVGPIAGEYDYGKRDHGINLVKFEEPIDNEPLKIKSKTYESIERSFTYDNIGNQERRKEALAQREAGNTSFDLYNASKQTALSPLVDAFLAEVIETRRSNNIRFGAAETFFDFLRGTFEDLVNDLSKQIEQGDLSTEDGVTNFEGQFLKKVKETSIERHQVDKEAFFDIAEDLVKGGKRKQVPTMPHSIPGELVKAYNDDTWVSGEEREMIIKHVDMQDEKTAQKVTTLLTTVLKMPSFKTALTAYFKRAESDKDNQ